MKRVIFVRHGHTHMNSDPVPRIRGFIDVPLNEIGVKEAVRVAQFISGQKLNIQTILSSPLTRCVQTAAVIQKLCAPALQTVIEQDVTEVNWGEWEGKTYSEATGTDHYESILPQHMNPLGGENLFAVSARCRGFINRFLNSQLVNAVVVSHGSVISLMLCDMLEIPINKYWTTYLGNAKAGVAKWDGSAWALEQWGMPATE